MADRLETGPARVAGDWAGVFIRGDNAHNFRNALNLVLEPPQDGTDEIWRLVCEGLVELLGSCQEPVEAREVFLTQSHPLSETEGGEG